MQRNWIEEAYNHINKFGQINETKWNTIPKIMGTYTQKLARHSRTEKKNRQSKTCCYEFSFYYCHCRLMFTTFKFNMLLFIESNLSFIYRWMLFAKLLVAFLSFILLLFSLLIMIWLSQPLNLNGPCVMAHTSYQFATLIHTNYAYYALVACHTLSS